MLSLNAKVTTGIYLCLLAALLLVSACESSDFVTATSESGTIIIDISPDDVNAPWELEGPENFTFSGAGDVTLESQTPGDYLLTYGSVDGYGAPAPTTGRLQGGGSLRFEDNYIARESGTGFVLVDPDPDGIGASWVLLKPDKLAVEGSEDSLLIDMSIGDYLLGWRPVPGWKSPAPNPAMASLVIDDTLTFQGTYTAIDTPIGDIIVRPTPESIDAEWTLTGPSGFAHTGRGVDELLSREVGRYTIEWSNVRAYRTPEPISESSPLEDGGVLTFTTDYIRGVGNVEIDVEPNDISAPWTLTNDLDETYEGQGDDTLNALPAGDYELTWGNVEGWVAPSPNPVLFFLEDGEQETVSGQYAQPAGTIYVEVSPDQASWTLVGPGLNEARSGDARFDDVSPGDYEIQWLDVQGYVTPVPPFESQSLGASETITFDANYALPGDPVIADLAGTGAHGSIVVINGANFGSHSLETYWTGDLIEDTPVGVNPDTWPNWKHRLSNDGRTDHITDEIAWSGRKSMDLTVDQTTGSYKSTLSYQVGDFRKMFLTYWLYCEFVTYAEGAKHLRITCDSECGSQAFSTPLNCFSHTGDLLPNGLMGKWGGASQARIGCSDNELVQFWEPFKNAYGVGYDMSSTPSHAWLRAHRGEYGPISVFGYQTGMWIRLDYYYDKGTPDTYSGEMRMCTIRPQDSPAGDAGLYIGKWEKNILMETDRTNCQDLTDRGSSVLPPRANIVGWMLFTDNPENNAHIRWFLDDVYVQTGTRARVELGDAPVYEDCTKLEIQEPVAWSGERIDVRLNKGGFASGETVYAFVITEDEWDNGNRDAYGNGSHDFAGISAGYPIVIE